MRRQEFLLCLGFAFFINDAKKQHIHSPIQTVVNLAETLFSPLLNSKANACYPEPIATIADCSHLTTSASTSQHW